MSTYNQNVAYKYDLFDEDLNDRKRAVKPQVRVHRTAVSRIWHMSTVLIMLLTAVSILLYLMALAKNYEISGKLTDQQEALSAALEEKSRLSTLLESKVTMEKIEQYATEHSMVKITAAQEHTVVLSPPELTEIADSSSTPMDEAVAFFENIWHIVFD
jgi:cell division protein FtsL